MVIRILASLALVPLLLFIVYGGLPLYIVEAILVGIALNEFYKAFKTKDIYPINFIGYIFSAYLILKNYYKLNLEITVLTIFILFLIGTIFILNKKHKIEDFSITFIGIFYIAIFIDHIVLTMNNFELGNIYVWLIFGIAFMTDTCAYFTGYFFGRHKLIPEISPKKTIEGSIGGIIGSALTCALGGYILTLSGYDISLNLIHMIIIGSVGSVIAQIGDLFASAIKRYVGIKDYGKLIPGHGGILDRFDSVILVAPFVYYVLLVFVG